MNKKNISFLFLSGPKKKLKIWASKPILKPP